MIFQFCLGTPWGDPPLPGKHSAPVWGESVDPAPAAGHDDDDGNPEWGTTSSPTRTGKKYAVRAQPPHSDVELDAESDFEGPRAVRGKFKGCFFDFWVFPAEPLNPENHYT